MKELNPKILEAMGLTEQDFEPAPMSDKERMDMQEDAILELAELIGEML